MQLIPLLFNCSLFPIAIHFSKKTMEELVDRNWTTHSAKFPFETVQAIAF